MSKNAVLAIDTSGTHLQLCLKTNGENHLFSQSMPRGHAEVMFDKIALTKLQSFYSKITSNMQIYAKSA